jgi:hypothetical protein
MVARCKSSIDEKHVAKSKCESGYIIKCRYIWVRVSKENAF